MWLAKYSAYFKGLKAEESCCRLKWSKSGFGKMIDVGDKDRDLVISQLVNLFCKRYWFIQESLTDVI